MIIYRITNMLNGKIYIGKRVGIFKSTYLGSGKNLKVAIKDIKVGDIVYISYKGNSFSYLLNSKTTLSATLSSFGDIHI